MHRVRSGALTATALTLILTLAVSTAVAAPEGPPDTGDTPPSTAANMPAPAEHEYGLPGSTPKPSAPMPSGDGLRFRGTLPASSGSSGMSVAPRHEPSAATTLPNDPPLSAANERPAIRPTIVDIPPGALSPAPATPDPQPAPRPAISSVPPAPATAAKPAAPKAVVTPAATPASHAHTAIVDDGDAFAVKFRELIASKKFEQIVPRKTERDAIVALYGKGLDFRPLWVTAGGPSQRAEDVIDYLRGVGADGLDPRDYPVPNFAVSSTDKQAESELKFTGTVLTFARHALNGRVHFSRLSPNVEYKLSFDPDGALKTIAASDDLRKTLDSFNPQQPAYRALKEKLAELREKPEQSTPPRFANGPVLRYHRDQRGRETIMVDPRVPKLRERLGVAAEPNLNYDRSLALAVGKFQKAYGLQATGQLNGATVDALNGPSRSRQLDAIVATMERWRWMPRDLGHTHVVLNIPDFNLRLYHGGAKVWQTRVVVGKPANQTPLLSETMKYITVNPTWNVPQSIIYNELLPIYETSDRQIFERQGLKLERNPDGTIRVFQPPGEHNALGQIRFNFPNKFLVYQHDTPERHYFSQERRAYSHGCMRVQDPLKYAELLLSYAAPRAGYTQARIRQMFGGQEQQLDFVNQIPVHITYQTAFVDEQGRLQVRGDVYGHDAKLASLMRGSERAVADLAIERPADPNFKPTPEAMQRLKSAAQGGVAKPFALSEQLFR